MLLPLLLFSCFTNPIVTRHDKEKEAFYVNSSDYPNVVQLRLRDLTGIVEMEGTLIRKDWIITAAHGFNSVEANQEIKIFDSTYTIAQIIIHPDFEGFENDIALVKLDRHVSEIEPVPLFVDSTEIGNLITIVGRGWTGTGLTGVVTNDQQFRIATNKIDSVSNHWLKFRFDEPENKNTTELEGISGPGDSGGPAFIDINGQSHLVGISSNQLNEQVGIKEGHYGVIEYYTRVSNYIQWINNVINGHSLEQEVIINNNTRWGFPDTEIGEMANQFMDAVASKKITDKFMEKVFYISFRESFDLKGFVQSISNSLVSPQIGEIRKAKNNVLIFTVNSENKTYLIQLEADKRDNYLIGGLFYKRISE